jgi:hypothetical protein
VLFVFSKLSFASFLLLLFWEDISLAVVRRTLLRVAKALDLVTQAHVVSLLCLSLSTTFFLCRARDTGMQCLTRLQPATRRRACQLVCSRTYSFKPPATQQRDQELQQALREFKENPHRELARRLIRRLGDKGELAGSRKVYEYFCTREVPDAPIMTLVLGMHLPLPAVFLKM